MKHAGRFFALLSVLALVSTTLRAQSDFYDDVMAGICEEFYEETTPGENYTGFKKIWHNSLDWCKVNNVADKLDLGISLSTMGLGIELKTPATKWADIRAGIDWMPRFNVPMSFNLNTFQDGLPTGNFNKVASMLYDMTGLVIDETVHMTGKGHMINFKFIVDVFPFQSNRHWHFSAGFYAGTSMVARAVNTFEEKQTLVGLNIYNRAFEYFHQLENIYDVPLGGGAYMDPEMVEKLQNRFNDYGRMGIHIGNFSHDIIGKDGEIIYKADEPYIMEPAPDGSISAKAYVNHFKPYIGAGYSTYLDPGKKWNFSVDLGALFWGGDPDVINHDYVSDVNVNFTKDLYNIRGKVGQYMKIVKALPVYPVLALRLSYSIL